MLIDSNVRELFMSRPLLKAAIRLFCTSILLITSAEIAGANACPCPPVPTVLDAYEAADAVVIVRVLSVQNFQGMQPGEPGAINARLVTGSVEHVYKGNATVKEQFSYLQEVWCHSTFYEVGIDSKILLYLKAPKEQYHRWNISTCGRSKPVLQATEDLLYLDNMSKLRGKTRVSGNYGAWAKQDFNIAHRRIRIVSDAKVTETVTDEKGVFEIYDLPPGKYRLEPEIPEGWRIDRSTLKHYVSTEVPQDSTRWARFVLAPQKHASVSFAFQPDNAVEGRIVGPEGKALANTCAYLRKPQEILGDLVALYRLGDLASGCSDTNGRFRIESIKPGSYVLVLNVLGKPRSVEPFPRVFSPSTTELEKATPIEIGLGETVKDVNVAVPFLLDTVTVAGVLRRSDGQPVPKQEVRFEPIGKPEIDGLVITETDQQGRFSLKILKGLEGTVYGGMSVVAGTFTRCPELKPLNFRDQDRVYVRSKDLKIETQQDLSNLVLQFLYPDCTIK
jgi:hypothetical protein